MRHFFERLLLGSALFLITHGLLGTVVRIPELQRWWARYYHSLDPTLIYAEVSYRSRPTDPVRHTIELRRPPVPGRSARLTARLGAQMTMRCTGLSYIPLFFALLYPRCLRLGALPVSIILAFGINALRLYVDCRLKARGVDHFFSHHVAGFVLVGGCAALLAWLSARRRPRNATPGAQTSNAPA